jgi:MerR family transcriptional regulator, light-induced transcriptional regulator
VPSAKKTPELLSIGELAEATGLSPDTLRVWERRYGIPHSVRLPSGHRRYTAEQLRWLRRVAEALSLGHRPGQVLRCDETTLSELLESRPTRVEPPEDKDSWLEMLRRFDQPGLESALRAAWNPNQASEFLAGTVMPLLVSVGRNWADGQLEVRHEHFLTEMLHDLLRSLRLSIGVPQAGPKILLAALEQEQYDLTLQMGALLAVSKGLRPQILGRNTPLAEIARTAVEMGVRAVDVPTPLSSSSASVESQVDELRQLLPDNIRLAVGWHDARFSRRPRSGVRLIRDLTELEQWMRELL